LKTGKSYQLFQVKTTLKVCFMICFFLFFKTASAQKLLYFPPAKKDTANKKKIQISQTDSLLYTTQELGKFRKLIGNVILKHEDATMYCDSAIIDIDANYMTAFGNQVHIKKADSVDVWGNFLEYFGDQKQARLTGMCSMRDKTMILTTPELNYNTGTDVGNYMSGGRVVNKETTITSAIGYYFHQRSDAVFYGDVVLKSPERTIYADSLRYNTETEIAYFICKTKIVDNKDSSVIETEDGFYDTKKEKAYFGKNAVIHKENSYVKANSIDYDNKTKISIAQGNVIFSDSVQRTTILSNYIYSNEDSSFLLAYKDPLMISVSEDKKDTMYLSADTLMSYKIPVTDTVFMYDTIKKDSIIDMQIKNDSVKIVKAYYKMKMIQGQMSANADSLFYSERDSIFKLYINPILWMDSTQITGDSIFLFTKNKEIHRVDVYNNAFIANLQDTMIFNQIKGKFIQAFIEDKKINRVEVDGNAESIYFIKDKKENAYTGANKSTSGYITVSFNEGEVNRIKLTVGPEAEFTPMKKLSPEMFRLTGFVWFWDKKPVTFYDVIRDRSQYDKYIADQPKKAVVEVKEEEKKTEE
jgi:lipopolysaccharide export system protein LptA